MACVIQLSCKYIFSYYCRAEQDSGKSGTIQRKATRSRWSTRRSKVDKYLVEQCIPTTHVYPRIVFKPMKMKNRLRSASVEDTAELSPEYKQIVDFVTHGWSSVKLEMEQGDVWKYHQDNKQQTKKCKGHYWLLIVCRGHEREVLPGEVQPAAGGLLPVWPGRVVGAPPLPEPHHRPVTAPRGDGQAAQVSTCSREKAWLVKFCITFKISIWSIIQNMWLKSYL